MFGRGLGILLLVVQRVLLVQLREVHSLVADLSEELLGGSLVVGHQVSSLVPETLRAWGRGKNRTDAIEQAKKNAVRDVLFKGVVAGSRECSVRPLITEVNAQERYASYFNDFFRDGGEYLKYVSMEDKKTNSNMKASNKTQISYSTTVRVLRSQLQQKLIEDKILKP